MSSSCQQKVERLAWIDTMKGVAILMVIIVHTSQRVLLPYSLKRVMAFGQFGCQFFFLLSGFTCSLSHSRRHSLQSFYNSRFVSIAPGYWSAIVISASVSTIECFLGREPIADVRCVGG